MQTQSPPVSSAAPTESTIAVEPLAADLFQTSNVALAAALITLGVPEQDATGGSLYRVTGDGITGPGQLCCAFAPRNADGSVETAKVATFWKDTEWCIAHDEEPLAWMRIFYLNLMAVAKRLKEGTPMVRISHGKYVAHVPADLPQAELDKYLQRIGV